MNNFIEYYYQMKVEQITKIKDYYLFKYGGYIYKLYIVDNYLNIQFMIDLNKRMLQNTLVDQIIYNKDRKPISIYNGIQYILMKVFVNINKKIYLEEINFLSNSLYTTKLNNNWGELWSKKIDYLEKLINENGKKYPLIVDSFNYFVGLAENAITYYNNINIPINYDLYISHKIIKINDKVDVLYNPLNIIFDYKVRDVAEYIKNAFFNENNDIYNEIKNYLLHNKLSLIDIKILVSRILYPSFYFELYDDILIDNKDEKIIMNIIDRLDDYQKYLYSIINYFRNWYDIDEVSWLNGA